MNIGILRVHNDWREERGSLDPLRGVVKMRENNACRERERDRQTEREKGGSDKEQYYVKRSACGAEREKNIK